MTTWSKWFGGASSRSAEASTPARTLTVGEVVNGPEPQSPYVLTDRCLLCEAKATVQAGESEAQIECADCGQYFVSLEAARALDALVKYREPALAEMRKMLHVYRQSVPDKVPMISVQYVVSAGVPTFALTSE